eukprot:2699172-Pyramimonas_sp.AAC.1
MPRVFARARSRQIAEIRTVCPLRCPYKTVRFPTRLRGHPKRSPGLSTPQGEALGCLHGPVRASGCLRA